MQYAVSFKRGRKRSAGKVHDMVERAGPGMQPSLSFEEPAFPASPTEADAVPCSDNHASTGKSILIVEDDALIAASLFHTLSSLGYTVPEPVATGEDAIRAVKAQKPDLVLMDIVLIGEMDGITAAEKIQAIADVPVIYLTAYTDDLRLKQARLSEPYGYIVKPAQSRELHAIIEMALYKHALDRKLRKSEEKFRLIVENSHDIIYTLTAEGVFIFVSPAWTTLLGHPLPQVTGQSFRKFVHPDDISRYMEFLQSVIGTGQRQEGVEYRVQHTGGTWYWHTSSAVPLKDEAGTITGFYGIARDITDHKQVDEALRASEQRYRDVIEDQTEFICRFSPDGRLTFINEAYCHYFGLNRKECIGKRHSVILLPDDAQLMKNHLAALTPENPVALISHRIAKPSGELRWHRWSDRAIYDKNDEVTEYQSVGRDITSLKETEIQLKNYKETLEQRVRDRTSELSRTNQKLIKEIKDRKKIQKKLTISSNEKDLLIREIHHRVKNNLQLILGLIDMTKMRSHDKAVLTILTDLMAKIQTMGLIHTRLFESKRFDKINIKSQIQDLIETISGIYKHDCVNVVTKIECPDVYLPVDLAIPCSLALNEIISNVYKHAFKKRRNGELEVLSSIEGNKLRIVVHDNGIGLPKGFDIEKSNRLGLKLIKGLVEQQLHGTVVTKSENGTEVIIEFPYLPPGDYP